MQRVEDQKVFDEMLDAPLDGGRGKPTASEVEDEGAAFLRFQAELAGG